MGDRPRGSNRYPRPGSLEGHFGARRLGAHRDGHPVSAQELDLFGQVTFRLSGQPDGRDDLSFVDQARDLRQCHVASVSDARLAVEVPAEGTQAAAEAGPAPRRLSGAARGRRSRAWVSGRAWQAARSSRISAAEAYRSSGRFSSARERTRSTSAGTSGLQGLQRRRGVAQDGGEREKVRVSLERPTGRRASRRRPRPERRRPSARPRACPGPAPATCRRGSREWLPARVPGEAVAAVIVAASESVEGDAPGGFQQLRQAEVEHLDVAGGRDHHVAGLHVAVDDPRRVSGRERAGDLRRVCERFLEGQAAPREHARRESLPPRTPWR